MLARPPTVLAIVTLAAPMTPTSDVATMMPVAVPMLLLYEIGVWIARFGDRSWAVDEPPAGAA